MLKGIIKKVRENRVDAERFKKGTEAREAARTDFYRNPGHMNSVMR